MTIDRLNDCTESIETASSEQNIRDMTLEEMMHAILMEAKKTNLYLQIMTDTHIKNTEVE